MAVAERAAVEIRTAERVFDATDLVIDAAQLDMRRQRIRQMAVEVQLKARVELVEGVVLRI